MRLLGLVASVLFTVIVTSAGEIDNKLLQCQVCRSTMAEIADELSKINPNLAIEIGNGRLDPQGNLIKKTVPLARSEIHISDIMDKICDKMSDYVRANRKSDGRLTIMKLVTPDGGMNPKMSEMDIIQDGDLNKSLQFLCEEIVEEHEDPINALFRNGETDIVDKACNEVAKVCDESMPVDDDNDVPHDDDPADEQDDDSSDRTEL